MTTKQPLHEEQPTGPISRELIERAIPVERELSPGQVTAFRPEDDMRTLFRVSDKPLGNEQEVDLFGIHANEEGKWVVESNALDPSSEGGSWVLPVDKEVIIGSRGIFERQKGDTSPPELVGRGKLPLVAQRLVGSALSGKGNQEERQIALLVHSAENGKPLLTLRNQGSKVMKLESHALDHEGDAETTQRINAETIKTHDTSEKPEPEQTQRVNMNEILAGDREEASRAAPDVTPQTLVEVTPNQAQVPEFEPQPPTPESQTAEPEPAPLETDTHDLIDTGDIVGTQVSVRKPELQVESALPFGSIASRLGVELDGEPDGQENQAEVEQTPAIELEGLTPAEAIEKLKTYATENLEAMSKAITNKYEALTKTIAATGMKVQPVAQGIIDAMTETEAALKGQSLELRDVSKITDAYAKAEQVGLELDAAMVAEQQLAIEKAQQMSGLLGTMSEQTGDSAKALEKAQGYLTTMQINSTSNYTNPEVFLEAQNKMLEELQKARVALTERGETRRKVTNMFED